MLFSDPSRGFGIAGPATLDQILRLLLVLLEARVGGQLLKGHTKLLSSHAWSPPQSG